MTRHVACLGDLMVDVVTVLSGPLRVGSDTAGRVRWSGGGSAANTACWLRAAGVEATLVARAGADVLGEWAVRQLHDAGIRGVVVDAERPTGTVVVLVGPDGERTMVPDPGANAALSPADVDAVGLAADHLHVSGYALFGAARAAALHALDRARALGRTVSVGAASAGPLRDVGAEAVLDWVGAALLIANRDEATVLTGATDPARAARLIARRTGEAVVTLGADGALWSDGDEVIDAPAEPVAVIDTTGAGDAFAAGYLAARGRSDPFGALSAGHRLAAAACGVVGGRPLTDAGRLSGGTSAREP